jgi:hypothetical protein
MSLKTDLETILRRQPIAGPERTAQALAGVLDAYINDRLAEAIVEVKNRGNRARPSKRDDDGAE